MAHMPLSCNVEARGHYAILRATLLLQLQFNTFPNTHLVPDEVTPYWRLYTIFSCRMI